MITFSKYGCVQYYERHFSLNDILYHHYLVFPLKLKNVIEVSIPKGHVDSLGR